MDAPLLDATKHPSHHSHHGMDPPITSVADPRLEWRNGKPGEGIEGSVELKGEGVDATLVVAPPAQRDFWSRTFYTPLLIKNDG